MCVCVNVHKQGKEASATLKVAEKVEALCCEHKAEAKSLRESHNVVQVPAVLHAVLAQLGFNKGAHPRVCQPQTCIVGACFGQRSKVLCV